MVMASHFLASKGLKAVVLMEERCNQRVAGSLGVTGRPTGRPESCDAALRSQVETAAGIGAIPKIRGGLPPIFA
jgi:hypothetical protein